MQVFSNFLFGIFWYGSMFAFRIQDIFKAMKNISVLGWVIFATPVVAVIAFFYFVDVSFSLK